jgi:hypothetical protein
MARKPKPAQGAGEADDDPHRGIPRDADGVPVFLILSPGDRQKYERRMASCERGWRDRRDPAAIAQAQVHVYHFRQVPPAWLVDAGQMLAYSRRTEDDAKREREAANHMARYMAVRDYMYEFVDGRRVKRTARNSLDDQKPTWPRAHRYAARLLKGTAAAGKPATQKASYNKVRKDLNEGRGGTYWAALPIKNKSVERPGELLQIKRLQKVKTKARARKK